jgi:alpha,alpha-trehalose phosphorylase
MYVRGDAFDADEKARNFAYYEARTARDSCLSAAAQAVVAAELGHLQLAHDYWAESTVADLCELDETATGLTIGLAAGGWTVAVAGFGGMRDHDGRLTFAPRHPPGLSRLAFRLRFRGRGLRVEVTARAATYELLHGAPLRTCHHGRPLTVAVDAPVTLPIPGPPAVGPVVQPPGRAPRHRGRGLEGGAAVRSPSAA